MTKQNLHSAPANTCDLNIDLMLQNTWLLSIELREGAVLQHSQALWQRCVDHLEQDRQQLQAAGSSPRSIELITHAQCVLIDECLMANAPPAAYQQWAGRPLQAHFCQRTDGGTHFYDNLREELASPLADPHVLTCMHRVLLLGFRGVYTQDPAPLREQWLARLAERVPPLSMPREPLLIKPNGLADWHGWRSPTLHVVAAATALLGLWWVLQRDLAMAIAALGQ